MDPSQAAVNYSELRHSPSHFQACCLLTDRNWAPPWKLHLFQRSCLAQSYTLNGSLHPVNSVEQIPSSLVSKCHLCVTAFIPWEWADTFVMTSVNQTLALINPSFLTPLQWYTWDFFSHCMVATVHWKALNSGVFFPGEIDLRQLWNIDYCHFAH